MLLDFPLCPAAPMAGPAAGVLSINQFEVLKMESLLRYLRTSYFLLPK
jgi:hypothetical protein